MSNEVAKRQESEQIGSSRIVDQGLFLGEFKERRMPGITRWHRYVLIFHGKLDHFFDTIIDCR